MSFTAQIKQEIANNILENHCEKAQLSALIQLTSSLTISKGNIGMSVRSESPTTSKRILYLLKKLYKVETELTVNKKTNLKKNNVYIIQIENNGREILKDLGLYSDKGLLEHPIKEITENDCCAKSYLSGAFLAFGTCNDPKTSNYHLEISFPDIELANFAVKLISRFNIIGKITERRKRYIVYVKKADYVSDFLVMIGANKARLVFEDERITRDMRNSFSRIDNCEIANEVKTIRAANKQIENIQLIKDNNKYEALPEKIKNVCELRIKYQDYSILELCDAYLSNYGELVSKSGMKHRLDKIESLAESLKED